MAKIISGLINSQGQNGEGDRYQASVLNQNPWSVVATYTEPFDRAPVAVTAISGSTPNGVSMEVQSSNTSLAIYTDSSEPLPIFFLATDRGL